MLRGLLLAFTLGLTVTSTMAQAPKKDTPQATGPVAEAKARLLKGNYAEAREAYEKLLKDEATRAPGAVGLARAWRAEGAYDKALTVLEENAKGGAADVLAEKADLLLDLGRWDEAIADAKAVLKDNPEHFLARWVQARYLRDTGDQATADTEVRWFVRKYTALSNADKDITDPELLAYVGQAGAENARWHNLTKQFSFILNEVYADALKYDPNYWWAEYHAGIMLLEKYNRPDALEAFEKALKINPKATEALVGKGLAALHRYEMKDAEDFVEQALKINPRHVGALKLKAGVQMIASDLPGAEKSLLLAKAVNPRDPATLGKLAAIYSVLNRKGEYSELVKAAETSDKKPGQFYFELGEALEERKQYEQAAECFKKSAELRPNMAGPRNALGLLYLRMGQEKEGRTVLTKAFETDPFNVRVANMIKVMKHLDKYETNTTAHYELKYDAKTDKLLAEILADYLEETHVELKRQFAYEPPQTILFQVFNSHEMFSGRTIGLPDLHTIGASTGRIVAMASPTAKGLRRPFNWGRVVRHELTHVFNLTQTNFQCPHWFTEGLAVRNEQLMRPNAWTAILRDRYRENTLLTLDNIMLGFVRPKGPDEWTLAYCQSQIYVEYMVKTYGEASVAKMLAAYQKSADTGLALKESIGVEQAKFEAGYKDYVAGILKPYGTINAKGKPAEDKPQTLAELEKEHEKDPKNADTAAKLSDAYSRRNKFAEARKFADLALELKKGHPLASAVKAKLLSRAGDEDGARVVVEAALEANPEDARLLMAVGRLFMEAKEYKKAAVALEKGRTVAPLDGNWLEQLVRLYTASAETDKLISVLSEIVSQDPDELDGRVKLAQASLKADKPADAERFAKDAIFIDVTQKDARMVLLEALEKQKKDAELKKWRQWFKE